MALTRERILETAQTLLSTYGLGDLSMRRLAQELGVAPGALYYHVRNKQQLLSQLATRILSPAESLLPPDEPPPGSEEAMDSPEAAEILAIGEWMFGALAEITDAADVVSLALAIEPESIPQRARIMELLASAGLNPEEAEWGTHTILSTVCGFVTHAQTRAQVLGEPFAPAEHHGFMFGLNAVISGLLA